MASTRGNIIINTDWMIVGIYLALVAFGIVNIYAADFNPEFPEFLNLDRRSGKQFLWAVVSIIMAMLMMRIDSKIYQAISYPLYFTLLIVQVFVFMFAEEVNGARAWLVIGPFKIQPAEFCKFATALVLGKYIGSLSLKEENSNLSLNDYGTNIGRVLKGKKVFSFQNISIEKTIIPFSIILLPVILIILQKDTGTALVFFALSFCLFREGIIGNVMYVTIVVIFISILTLMFNGGTSVVFLGFIAVLFHAFLVKNTQLGLSLVITLIGYFLIKFFIGWEVIVDVYVLFGWVATIGIYALIKRDLWKRTEKLTVLGILMLAVGYIFSIDFFYNILKPYQRKRIDLVLGKIEDQDVGFQTEQSLNAIGSGGFTGKGFLEGTHTKGHWVPEQSTDYIFTTVGEEWGFIGSLLVVGLFIALILRIIYKAEKQRSTSTRIYGYGVASILFFHLLVNIGMTIQMMPVIGIPLPFFSYGGSSLVGFTILLFLFVKFDSQRLDIL